MAVPKPLYKTVTWTLNDNGVNRGWLNLPETGWTWVERSYSTSETWRDAPLLISSDNKTSVKTPNYRYLKRNRLPLPDNFFHRSGVKIDSGSFYASHRTPTYTRTWTCTVSPFTSVGNLPIGETHPIMSKARTDATFQLLDKARQQKWNTPVFLAEAGKTADMVYNRAHHLTYLARQLRRGNFLGFISGLSSELSARKVSRGRSRFDREFQRDPSKAAGNAWLEYTYGWVPFMSDVKNAVTALFDQVEREPRRTYISTGRGSHRKVVPQSVKNTKYNGFSVDYSLLEYFEASCKLNWRYRVESGSLPNRFGLDNPAVVAWELVPFSFVADWFLPIGDYLSQFDVDWDLTHLGGSEIRIARATVTDYTIKSRTRGYVIDSTFSSVARALERHPLRSKPFVSAAAIVRSMTIEGLTERFSRQISSVALLRQQLSRFSR